MGESAGTLPTLGWDSLALSFASLGVVCVLAFVALKFLAGRGVGRATGVVKVLARCPLEPRRSVYLIETAGRCFLVGVGDGSMSLLAEIDGTHLQPPAAAEHAGRKFSEVLAGVMARPRPPISREPKP